MRTLRTLFTLALTATASTVAAQTKPTGFGLGYMDVGPALGLGGINGASASFGGRFEKAVKALPDMGNGTLGIQASFDYYSYSTAFIGGNWSYRYIPIGVTANYHFKLQDQKFDPFIGLGLGYSLVSCSWSGSGVSGSCANTSAVYAIGRVGGRYFFSPKMAAYADVGAGAATLNVGLMFRMK